MGSFWANDGLSFERYETENDRYIQADEKKGEKEFTTIATTDIDDHWQPSEANEKSHERRAQTGDWNKIEIGKTENEKVSQK